MNLSELVVAFKNMIGRTLDGKWLQVVQNQHLQSIAWVCLVFVLWANYQ